MANNVDRLFRENLDQFEVTPSAQSWDEVQRQLAKKKNKGLWMPMSIAAAVIVVIVASILVINTGEGGQANSGNTIASIDAPTPQTKNYLPVQVPEPTQVVTKIKNNTKEPQATRPTAKQKPVDRVIYSELNIAMIHSTGLDAAPPALSLKSSIKGVEPEKTEIKITYIAVSQPDSTKTKLGDFIASLSKEVSPSGFLADIRDVKDNLFSKN